MYLAKRPRTFETTMWRTEKLMPECAPSMFQVPMFMGVPSNVSERGVPPPGDLHAPSSCPEPTIVLSIGLDGIGWKDYPMGGIIDDGPE